MINDSLFQLLAIDLRNRNLVSNWTSLLGSVFKLLHSDHVYSSGFHVERTHHGLWEFKDTSMAICSFVAFARVYVDTDGS